MGEGSSSHHRWEREHSGRATWNTQFQASLSSQPCISKSHVRNTMVFKPRCSMYTRVHVFTDKLKHLPSLIALMFRKILMLTLALKEIGLLLNKIQGITQFLKKRRVKKFYSVEYQWGTDVDYVCLTSLVVACASVGQQLRVAVKDLRQLLQRKPPKATKKRKDLQSSQREMFKGLALTLAQRVRLAAGSMECSSPQSRTVTSSKYNKEERGGQEGCCIPVMGTLQWSKNFLQGHHLKVSNSTRSRPLAQGLWGMLKLQGNHSNPLTDFHIKFVSVIYYGIEVFRSLS